MYKCYSLPEKKRVEADFKQLHADNNVNISHSHLKLHAAVLERCDDKKGNTRGLLTVLFTLLSVLYVNRELNM